MGKGFKGKTCVYCAAALAATMDHVFAREFFIMDRRANLSKVPACQACNSAKSGLEHYLTAVLPFGGRHADGAAHLSGMVPGRLARNQKLARRISAELSIVVPDRDTLAMTVPIDPEKIAELFALIAKGLLWHHWQCRAASGYVWRPGRSAQCCRSELLRRGTGYELPGSRNRKPWQRHLQL
jgi:hypothetical protein